MVENNEKIMVKVHDKILQNLEIGLNLVDYLVRVNIDFNVNHKTVPHTYLYLTSPVVGNLEIMIPKRSICILEPLSRNRIDNILNILKDSDSNYLAVEYTGIV